MYDVERRVVFGTTTFECSCRCCPRWAPVPNRGWTGCSAPRPRVSSTLQGGDFDLDLLETRTRDGRTQELVYRPHPPHLADRLTACSSRLLEHRRQQGRGVGAELGSVEDG